MESEIDVWMFLSRTAASASLRSVVVVPFQDNWNDFGYRTQANVGVRGKNGELNWFSAKFAVKDEVNTWAFAEKVIGSDFGVRVADLSVAFATLLSDARSYGAIGRILEKDDALSVMQGLRDVAVYMNSGKIPDWSDFFDSEVFGLSMVRSSEGYYAARRGRQMLLGEHGDAGDLQRPFAVSLRGKSSPDVDFNFLFSEENRLRGRISVVVGQNGCGKTASVSRIARGVADRKVKGVSFSDRPAANQVLAFAHAHSKSQFLKANRGAGSARIKFYEFGPARKIVGFDSDVELLVEVARADDIDGSSLQFFKKFIRNEFPTVRIKVPVKAGAASRYGVEGDDAYADFDFWGLGGEQRRLQAVMEIDVSRPVLFYGDEENDRRPSLGQLTFIRFCLCALAGAGPSSLIVVDEPESYLHPNLVSKFIRLLSKILEQTDSIAIVATHSPFVVREVQSAHVHVIREVDGFSRVLKPRLQTLGANVAAISNEVFGDDLIDHLHEDILGLLGGEFEDFDRALEMFSEDLSVDALMQLRRKIEVADEEN